MWLTTYRNGNVLELQHAYLHPQNGHTRSRALLLTTLFPNDLVVQQILPPLLDSCDLTVRVVSDDDISMCKFHSINWEWGWLVSSTPNYASFCVVNHTLRIFKGHRHRWWFENKVLSKYNQCLEIFKMPILCPPHMLLRPLVTPFPNLSLKEMVVVKDTMKEAKYGHFDANTHVVVRMCFPPRAGLFRSLERFVLVAQDD